MAHCVVRGRRDVSFCGERDATQIVHRPDGMRIDLVRVEQTPIKRAVRVQLFVDKAMQARVALGQPVAPRPRRTPLGIGSDVGGQTRSPSLSLPMMPYGNSLAGPCGDGRLTPA